VNSPIQKYKKTLLEFFNANHSGIQTLSHFQKGKTGLLELQSRENRTIKVNNPGLA